MKKLFLFSTIFLIWTGVYGQTTKSEYSNLIKKADSLYQAKDFKNSALTYSSAFKVLGWKGLPDDRYNAARAWTMAKTPDSAFFNLQRIVDKGYYSDYDKITKEEDFKSLYSDNRWQPLLDQIKYNKLPSGWFRAGSKPLSYRMTIDSTSEKEKRQTLTIKSIDKKIDGFGTIMQTISPGKYLGKRICMTGYLKSKDVDKWAGFWMRVDDSMSMEGSDYKQPNAFDNMQDRPIKGTKGWKKYKIVLDVDSSSNNIAFGVLLVGTGQIWFEKINLRVVDKTVSTTGNSFLQPKIYFNK